MIVCVFLGEGAELVIGGVRFPVRIVKRAMERQIRVIYHEGVTQHALGLWVGS